MKKIILVAAVGMLALASCKKDYKCTCTVLGVEVSTPHNDLDKDSADDAKEICEAASCTWSKK